MNKSFIDEILDIQNTVLKKYEFLFERIVNYETKCFDSIFNALIKFIFLYNQSFIEQISPAIQNFFSQLQKKIEVQDFDNSYLDAILSSVKNVYNDTQSHTVFSGKNSRHIFENILNHLCPKYIKILCEKIGIDLLSKSFRILSFDTISLILTVSDDKFIFDILHKICQDKEPDIIESDTAMFNIITITLDALSDGLIKLPYEDYDNYFKASIVTKQTAADNENCNDFIPLIEKNAYNNMTLSERTDFFLNKIFEKYSVNEDAKFFKNRTDMALHFASTLHNKTHINKPNLLSAIDMYFVFPNSDSSYFTDDNETGIDPITKEALLDILIHNNQKDTQKLIQNMEKHNKSFLTDLDYKLDYNCLESVISKKFNYLTKVKLIYVNKVRYYLTKIKQLFDSVLQIYKQSIENNLNTQDFESYVLQTFHYFFDNDDMILSSEREIPHIEFIKAIHDDIFSLNNSGKPFFDFLNNTNTFLESNFSSMFVYFYHLYTLPFSQFQTVVRLINRKKLITVLNKYPRFCSEYVYSCFSENGMKRLEEDMKFISPLAFPYSEFVERKTMADLYKNKNKYFRLN